MYENTGILTIHGKTYAIDTYYPLGKRRPEYKIFCVWEKSAVLRGESHTFASEDGFIDWLDEVQAPRQMGLL